MKSFAALSMLLTLSMSVAAEEVDTILVLSTDVSASIWDSQVKYSKDILTSNEYQLQKEGIALALRDPEVIEAVKNCNPRGVALTYVEWSGGLNEMQAKQVVGWQKLTDSASMDQFAKAVERAPRSYRGQTDIMLGLAYSAELILNGPFQAPRKIIDISGDGVSNIFGWTKMDDNSFIGRLERGDMRASRDKIVSHGITINALSVEGEDLPLYIESLRSYFQYNVIGGSDSFVMPIDDFGDYGAALVKKLKRELCPFTS